MKKSIHYRLSIFLLATLDTIPMSLREISSKMGLLLILSTAQRATSSLESFKATFFSSSSSSIFITWAFLTLSSVFLSSLPKTFITFSLKKHKNANKTNTPIINRNEHTINQHIETNKSPITSSP